MKKVLFILILSLTACRKTTVIPTPQPNVKIFDVRESSVENGQEIEFDLAKSGIYTLTLGDSINNQVLTRERFNGQIGITGFKRGFIRTPLGILVITVVNFGK